MMKAFDAEGGTAADAAEADTGTIAWLLPELSRTFDRATTALREFRATAAGVDRADVDLAPLRVARSHLHQAHGALELGELAGVTRLTEAIEEFLALFEEDPARCDATALDAIIGGCRAIVEYLEDLQAGVPQQPLFLFPSYRDILIARGADRVHPADLFMVDLTIRPPRDGGGLALSRDQLGEARSRFERSLLRYIRNENDGAALAELARAVTAIDASVGTTATPAQSQQRAFWWATRALFDALASDGFARARANHAHLKRLAGRVNLQIRRLADGSNAVAERLMADTLFFVAIAEPVTAHVQHVQQRYRLVGAVPPGFDTQRYGRIDANALRTAREGIAAAKGCWAAVVAGDVAQIHEFAKHTSAVLDAVGSIRRPGLAQVAKVIDGIATDLGFDPRQPKPGVGLDVATALLFLEGALERARLLDDAFDERAALVVARVEASALGRAQPATSVDWLDRMSREAEERLTVATFVEELQANLRSAEKELDAFFRDPAARLGLPEAQKALAQVSGALALLGHDDVHRAIDRVRETVTRFESDENVVDTAAFEELAQSLGAVGFYVEQIKRDRIDPGAFHFDPRSGAFSAEMARPQPAVRRDDDRGEDRGGDRRDDGRRDAAPAAAPVPYSEIAFAATQVLDEQPAPAPERDLDSEAAAIFEPTQIFPAEATLEDEIARSAADAAKCAAELRTTPDDRALRAQMAEHVDTVRRSAALIDDRVLQDEAATVLAALRRVGDGALGAPGAAALADSVVALEARANRSVGIAAPAVTPLEPAVAVPSAENHEAIDAELLEIFLEEAAGVLVDADASLRVLDADPANETATVNLRRGFHTLKGSSRMVGLMTFGDAAWAIESLLNAHIADQAAASTDLRALVAYAIRYLSGWVEELRDDGSSSRVSGGLVDAARAVRTGVAPELGGLRDFVPPVVHDAHDAHPDEAPVVAAADEDAAFTATEVFDDAPFPAISFFGEQPATPAAHADDDASVEAGRDVTVDHAVGEESAGTDGDHPFADTSSADPVAESHPGATDAPAVNGDQAASPRADESATSATPEAIAIRTAIDTDAANDADVAIDPSQTFAAGPPQHVDHAVDDVLASLAADTEGGLDGDASRDREQTVAADNVLPFTMRSPAGSGDEMRQIGPLTLSVALFNIYLSESDELLRVLTQDFAEWRHELHRLVSERAMRAAHSLAGSSATVGLVPAHDLAAGIEEVLQALHREPIVLDAAQVGTLEDAVESLRRMLHRFAAERMPEPDAVRVAALIALRRAVAGGDFASTDIGAAEPAPFDEGPATVDEAVFLEDPATGHATEVPVEAFESVEPDSASDASHPATAGRVADEPVAIDDTPFEPVAEPATTSGTDATARDRVLPEHRIDEASTAHEAEEESRLQEAHEARGTVDAHDADGIHPAHEPQASTPAAAVHDDASQSHDSPGAAGAHASDAAVDPGVEMPHEAAFAATTSDVHDHAIHDHADEAVSEAGDDLHPAAIVEADAPAARRTGAVERESTVRDDIDLDLLDVFVEEGNEILPQIGALLRTWQAHRDNAAPARMLLRHLHTLKGSARMAGAMRLGEVVHDIETRVEAAARLHEVPATLVDELLAAHDRSLELFDRLQHPQQAAAVEAVAAGIEPVATTEVPAVADAASLPASPAASSPDEPKAADAAATKDGRTSPVVRVASDTLDRLVNLAGEVSISRARIENEVLQIKGAMGDLSDNVDRLRTQLREIELQAEFQMQSRMQSQQAAGEEREKFDPLEFDRFTRFQELTRMMAESVNDVKTVQQHLAKSLDTAEADLTSQRRMTRDLQQDLMQVRMVPFSSIAERLYRTARRAAKEVDKRVNLDIRGGSVEIDRSVLERMAGPFEHLLRNHIVHGVESRDARRAAGKDETGELLVEVRQEGNEIVLTFSDDGAGLDHARIRAKGRELGLVTGEIADAQAAELIFHPGFSTATEVTELAGRGVGLDVVRSEATELSGRVSVDSEAGRGTRFTINLPLTLAVTQVVLVSVAQRVYALPAVLVEQVQQLRPQPLADAYRAGELAWSGSRVRLAFLGTLLGIDDSVPVAQRTSPVLILRSAAERIAIHVDEVIGNQEVVVKTLGPQLARMSGIAGATVLGSGEIVLILNPVQLGLAIRTEAPPPLEVPVPVAEEVEPESPQSGAAVADLLTLPTVMVVDDSLTVRRVTQRLLSREGYQVVLAKDGVDALEQLQDYPPDAMLVDIEMPRMDGFDLTRNVRNDDRFRHIPIIMITSRTAEKHRTHAAKLGVDAYLGKPYQEDELIELLAKHVASRRSLLA